MANPIFSNGLWHKDLSTSPGEQAWSPASFPNVLSGDFQTLKLYLRAVKT